MDGGKTNKLFKVVLQSIHTLNHYIGWWYNKAQKVDYVVESFIRQFESNAEATNDEQNTAKFLGTTIIEGFTAIVFGS